MPRCLGVTKLIVQPAAERDFVEALNWYADRSREISLAFETAVREAFDRIAAAPNRWPALTPLHRFHLVERFPYFVVYRVLPDVVEVFAVAHTSRSVYWRKR